MPQSEMLQTEFKAIMREPHLYAMMLNMASHNLTYLWSGIDYTFESAFDRARKKFLEDNKEFLDRVGGIIGGPTMTLLNSQKLEDAMRAFDSTHSGTVEMVMVEEEEPPTKRKPPEETKSGLMQRIIDTQSRKMFDLYKDKFSQEEQKLIKETCKWK